MRCVADTSSATRRPYGHTRFYAGVVTVQDLGRVMRGVGLEPSEDELANMITEVDGSGVLPAHGFSCLPFSLSL